MRINKGLTLVLCLLVMTLCVSTVFGQETTAGIQGTVKDATGAVVSRASVELSSSALQGVKKQETDSGGNYRFSNLPPGDYVVTISAKGFKTLKQGGVKLIAGAVPSLDLKLEIGAVEQTVEVSSAPPMVDVTESKVSTTVSDETLASIPKGRSYQSVIPFAPGARQEALQSSRSGSATQDPGRVGGYQIDGASDSENVYMTEGLNTTAIYGGGVGANVPFEFIQEVQVKSSSFEAEFGGANGGVINVIQKRGGPQWHGSVFAYYRGDPINANDQCLNREVGATQGTGCGLRLRPGTALNSGSGNSPIVAGDPTSGAPIYWANRKDGTPEYYRAKQDKWDIVEPGFEAGGPLYKDRLWLFSSYVPTMNSVTRNVRFTGTNPGPRGFTQSIVTHNLMNRLDYRLSNSVRLFGSWQGGYARMKGNQAALSADSVIGQVNTSAGTDPTTLRSDTGSTNPTTILNFGADINVGSKLVITPRYGYFYTDQQDRGKTTGTRYVWQVDSTGIAGAPASDKHTAGFANIPSNFQGLFDVFSRRQFTTDVSYYVGHFGGSHNLKAGYSVQRLAENVAQSYVTSLVNIWFGGNNTYTTASGPTNTVCAAVITKYGKCGGPDGYYVLSDGVLTNGNVSALNHAIYFQDSWTIKGLTINGGVRFDKEFLPPYRPGALDIAFPFSKKIAPRLGVAYDLFHNGKLKLYGSYGKFFDIMKYSLPRGSFGGDRWHDCAYALNTNNYATDYTSIIPTNVGGKFCPDSGPAIGSGLGDFIENQNWRASAPGNPADPVLDPNMKPMQTHEFVMGADWAISKTLAFETRYARKRLDWTIEDMSLDDGQYYIGNPGSAYSQLLTRALPSAGIPSAQCPTCPLLPKAQRDYDGLEFRLVKKNVERWGGQLSYTWSRLHGNYAGLADTQYTDGNGGRHEPNNGRAFDLPQMLFDGQGHAVSGPLSTDRPNVLYGFGYYKIKWWNQETLIGMTQSFAQGSPQSTCLGTVDSASSCMFIAGEGNWVNFHQDPTTGDIIQDGIVKGKRSPTLIASDFNLTHELKVSKTHEGMRLGFNFNCSNCLNQRAALVDNPGPLATGYTTLQNGSFLGWDYLNLETNFNYLALMNDKSFTTNGTNANGFPKIVYAGTNTNGKPNTLAARYGMPVIYQNARAVRIQVKFTF